MMERAFKTLRVRFALPSVIVFALVQFAIWLGVDVVRGRYLLARFDRELVERSDRMAHALVNIDMENDERVAGRLGPFAASDVVIALYRGATLRFVRGPGPTPAAPGEARPAGLQLSTVGIESAQHRWWRVARRSVGAEDTLTVAMDLAPPYGMIAQSRRLLLAFGVVSLPVAALTAWSMTRRTLASISNIARQAREISVASLGERLPLPEDTNEISALVEVINDMLDRLDSGFRRQSQFIALVSHELKTPLAVLLGEAQALRRRPATEAMNAFPGVVEEETRQLLRTVESFLMLTRATGDRVRALQWQVSIDDSVLEVVHRLQDESRLRGVRIVTRLVEDEDELCVRGDPELLQSMIENLLRNAIRYSPAVATVDVSVSTRHARVVIEVRDRGPGISPETGDHIFEMFYQAAGQNRSAGLAGIGLSIVRSVVQLHDGTIGVENCPDGGCVFTVSIPAATEYP